MGNQYRRHLKVDLEYVFGLIEKNYNKPAARETIEGFDVGVSSTRLKTFYHAHKNGSMKCVTCGLESSFFAVESFNHGSPNSQHLNLYAEVDGVETLMTHDHIQARGLGGEDSLSNTQLMCSPCNNKKGNLEGKIANLKKTMEKMTLGQKEHMQALLDARKNPIEPARLEMLLNDWAAKQTAQEFAKRIDTYLQKFGWKRKMLKQLMNQGVINFTIHPVRD